MEYKKNIEIIKEEYCKDKVEKKKQHYVPVFYLEYFCNRNGVLWAFDKKEMTFFDSIPKGICYEKLLYELDAENNAITELKYFLPNCIENMFCDWEGNYSTFTKELIGLLDSQVDGKAIILNHSEKEKLYDYINNLLLRNPYTMSVLLSEQNTFEKFVNSVDELSLTQSLSFFPNELLEPFKKALLKLAYFTSKEGMFSFIPILRKSTFVFLKAEDGNFITSDFPVVLETRESHKTASIFFFPLTKKYGVNFFYEDTPAQDRNRLRIINKKQVEDLNKYVFTHNISRFCISHDKRQLSKILKEVKK